ncbi:MAG: 3-carboxy-cis,cis-muconate lactonizing enzyme, partial [Candidatus Angelobacter sp.]|nr:3-carboxy-cis,cis-muconate lactonizing enzyme [Candidatus Angelobacter sp.]
LSLSFNLYSQESQRDRTTNLPNGQSLANGTKSIPINSLPATLAISPDGHFVVSLNNGFGTVESGLRQSMTVLNLATNEVTDFPDSRLGEKARQSYFLGLAFNPDGETLYASMSSISDPEGQRDGSTGNGIAVYSFHEGKIAPKQFFKIPLQPVSEGKTAAKINAKLAAGKLIPYPAGIAFVPGGASQKGQLLVADNLSDDALLLDASTGEVVRRFDLSTHKIVPGSYPYTAVVSRDGKRGYVSLWNASAVAELDLRAGTVKRTIPLSRPQSATESGSHPTAMLFSADEKRLYVALANRDLVAVINTATGALSGQLSTKLPGQKYLGASPVALAASADGKQLFVANAGSNSVAVFETKPTKAPDVTAAAGFIPTEWYPQALAVHDNRLIVASGKGSGVGPNRPRQKPASARKPFPYILSLIHGSLASVDIAESQRNLAQLTQQVIANNHVGRKEPAMFAGGASPIKHVIYIIKENRTYDQVFGDLPGANGDASLVMYGEQITPNQHKLAREFGILDNFYDSGEVSGDGHNWSTAASGSDYLEKTIEVAYRGSERTYDFEGEVAHRFPLEDEMPDVNETGTGYIWGNVARKGLTYRHYGEFISTSWCNDKSSAQSPLEGTPAAEGSACQKTSIKKGEELPAILGYGAGTQSPWPWPIPNIAKNTPTKPELRGHFDPNFPDFNLSYPDQLRADEFLREFKQFVENRGKDPARALPNYVLLRLGNDHTSGTKAGVATPSAAVADNDLAVGRVVDAVSNSPYWDDTAILILEDDAQDGPDHVDAHRSIALVISKYSPSSAGKSVVDSQFYTTVSMMKTLEVLLGLPAMNNNDENAPAIASLFAGRGNHEAFTADYRNRENGLLYEANKSNALGAKASAKMDFNHADRADTGLLNAILWRDRMGNKPMPKIRGGSSAD